MTHSPEIEEKACDIFEGLEKEAQADRAVMLAKACTALALLTSTRKEEREAGKRMVRGWKAGGKEFGEDNPNR